MPQLSLRLVAPPPPPPGGGAASPGAVRGAGERDPRNATIADLRALVGSRGRMGIVPPPPPAVPAPEARPTLAYGAVSTGLAALDTWLRGWPRPGVIELAGPLGAGRLALVLPLVERLTRQGRPVLLVDPQHLLHPPGLGAVDPSRIVLVRPPGERAAWAAEQVARSGAVEALFLLDAPPLGRGGVRLARAAEAGGMHVFVLSPRPEPELPASLRLEVEGWREERLFVRCTRCRDGRVVGERLVSLARAEHVAGPDVSAARDTREADLRVGRG